MKAWKKGAIVGSILYVLGGIIAFSQIIDVSQGFLNSLFFAIYVAPYMLLWGPITSIGLSEGIAGILANMLTLVIFASIVAKIGDSIEKNRAAKEKPTKLHKLIPFGTILIAFGVLLRIEGLSGTFFISIGFLSLIIGLIITLL